MTPLHCGAKAGYLDVVQYICLMKGNPNSKNASGDLPLHIACRSGDDDNIQIAKYFIENLHMNVDVRAEVICGLCMCGEGGQ